MKIKFKKIHPKAKIPERINEFAGGWDVFCTEIVKESNDFYICKLGFSLEIPIGYKLTLVPRSSLTKTYWIQQNSPGLGDSDYRGEYQYRFRAIPNKIGESENSLSGYLLQYPEFPYKPGDRIGQIYLEEIIPIEFEEADELSDTGRGFGGFGSTGK